MPVLDGRPSAISLMAENAPAEPPMPTTGKGFSLLKLFFVIIE
jgi:hypothetical protein